MLTPVCVHECGVRACGVCVACVWCACGGVGVACMRVCACVGVCAEVGMLKKLFRSGVGGGEGEALDVPPPPQPHPKLFCVIFFLAIP